jgi:hypothetical protein
MATDFSEALNIIVFLYTNMAFQPDEVETKEQTNSTAIWHSTPAFHERSCVMA